MTRGLITWLAYTISGLVSLPIASPGSHVSQLFLAAGVGLGLVIGWGPAMLPAVGLGSATVVACALLWFQPDLPLHLLALQAATGTVGASLQAWIGWQLIGGRRDQPLVLELGQAFKVLRFLLLVGPVSCVTHALISVQGMYWQGQLPASLVFEYSVRWWAGDTIGVLLATPIVLTWVGRPESLWQARRWVLGGPMVVAAIALGLAIRHVHQWDLERENSLFRADVAALNNEVNLRLTSYLDALESLHGVYLASEEVNSQEFAAASDYWTRHLRGVQAIGWAQHVHRKDLASLEAESRQEPLNHFRVFDFDERSGEVRPPAGDSFMVIRHIQPMQNNQHALGLNILSRSAVEKPLEQSLALDEAVATPGFQLYMPGTATQQVAVAVHRPVYTSPHTRSQNTVDTNAQGVVFVVLRMDDALAGMLGSLPRYLGACLLEDSNQKLTAIGGDHDCHDGHWGQNAAHRKAIPLKFAGANWQLVVWARQEVPLIGRGTTSWWLTAGGVMAMAALCTMLLVISDHTGKLESAMREAEAQKLAAEAANDAKSEFLSRMSHELRTPLNAVLGFAQVMDIDKQAPLPPAQLHRLHQIQQAGWHLLDMIDDVLDISRIESGTLRLSTQPVAVSAAVSQICLEMKDQAANIGIELSWPDDTPAEWGAQADPTRLRQILHALIDNGITYNQRPGSVKVTVSFDTDSHTRSNWARISVTDTGMGLSRDQLGQLFQPFNRLGREKQIPDGTGVSLSISRHLAKLMGGQLDARSTEGMGATFTLCLPGILLPVTPASEAPPTPAANANTPTGTRHMLYVEDNLANSEVVRAALEAHPWIRLSIAPTIEQGLAVLHNRLQGPRPDLILLDVHLPDASGLEFLRLVKANPETSGIPVIIVSADAMPEQIETALAAGAACYLTKPVQINSLLLQVSQLLQPTST